jgi:tRNA (mo5U34)-methyltransferase
MIRFRRAARQQEFAARIAGIKSRVRPEPFDWYPYDSFANLQHLEKLVSPLPEGLRELAGESPVGDFGAGDGELAFWLESLGLEVIAADFPGSNANQMRGIELLKQELGSNLKIWRVDLDQQFTLDGQRFGLVLCLGLLYHLKNPVFFLEKLSRHARYCVLSTRILPRRTEQRPIAYFAGDREINDDPTNFWFFAEAGLLRLIERCGWLLVKQFNSSQFQQGRGREVVLSARESHRDLRASVASAGWMARDRKRRLAVD